ncbi:MAG: NAD(P)-binding protein [Promethearchaeota archaeon]
MKITVIGSGLAGLTAGALCAKAGHDVTIYGQHEKTGGIIQTNEKNGYRWDWGQMLIPDLCEGDPGHSLLKRLGISELVKVKPSYREDYFPAGVIGAMTGAENVVKMILGDKDLLRQTFKSASA